MVPIFEQGHGQGIGHSLGSFLKRFLEICEEHLKNERATSFAFILYDFYDQHIQDILKNQGGFTQLDRLSGNDISVFYLNSSERELFKTFNEIFLGAFEIKNEYSLPLVLFFNIETREVSNVEIIELEQTDPMFAFKELYDCIENYKRRIENNSVSAIKPKANRLTSFIDTVKKASLEIFIEWTIEKGGDKIGGSF